MSSCYYHHYYQVELYSDKVKYDLNAAEVIPFIHSSLKSYLFFFEDLKDAEQISECTSEASCESNVQAENDTTKKRQPIGTLLFFA